ncbi:MAG: hypothetical protein N2109_03665 [Fimbriimonadales bacterium]|nr:hypothetical protein [Fimbriimonadales bacterium]
MIAPWVLWVLGNGLRVLELPNPGESTVTVAAAVRLPELSPSGLAAARTLAEALRAGSSGFSRARWLVEGSLAGVMPSVEVARDALLVRLTAAPGRHLVAASYVADLLRNPDLGRENLQRAWETARRERRDLWESALDPRAADFERLGPSQAAAFGRWLLRPERVAVSICGPFAAGQGASALKVRLEDWSPQAPSRLPHGLEGQPVEQAPRRGDLRVWRWTLPWEDLSDGAMGRAWLVASALGSGKGSALFRAWRVEGGLTYRQELRIEGRAEGLAWSLTVARSGPWRAEDALGSLRGWVGRWTEADRRRALAMIDRRGPSPLNDGVLALTGVEPWRPLPWEEAELAAYWAMKTGRALDLGAWSAAARDTPLEELRRTALDALQRAQLAWDPGSSNSG